MQKYKFRSKAEGQGNRNKLSQVSSFSQINIRLYMFRINKIYFYTFCYWDPVIKICLIVNRFIKYLFYLLRWK